MVSTFWMTVIHFFIHPVFCLKTGPKPPPKWFLHIVWSRASSYKWPYPLLSLRSSSSFLHLLPHLLVTSISPFIFPLITCFRRQFLHKMWPIQLAIHFLILYDCHTTGWGISRLTPLWGIRRLTPLWGICQLTPLHPTNGMSYAPGSQYIVGGGKAVLRARRVQHAVHGMKGC